MGNLARRVVAGQLDMAQMRNRIFDGVYNHTFPILCIVLDKDNWHFVRRRGFTAETRGPPRIKIKRMAAVALGLLIVVLIALLVFGMAGRSHSPASPETNQTAAIIDESLKEYKDQHRSDFGPSIFWHCVSGRLSFGISLSKSGGIHPITVTIHAKLPFVLELPGGKNPQKMNDAAEKIMQSREIPALLEHLDYFDFVTVHGTGVIARCDNFNTEKWHSALAGLLTFARYLLEFENREIAL